MEQRRTSVRLFEAFAGYGSQAIAFNEAIKDDSEYSVVLAGISEIDENACAAYFKLHGKSVKNYGDITQIHNQLENLGQIDFFTYSFPCQDISRAGKRAGFAKQSGTRSALLWCCLDIIQYCKPSILLMENVKDICNKNNKPYLEEWINELDKLGYRSHSCVLDSHNYGSLQRRERFFLISILGDGSFHEPEPLNLRISTENILEKRVDKAFYFDFAA